MTKRVLQRDALALPLAEREALLLALVRSLDAPSPAEVDQLWLDAAAARATEVDQGKVVLRPAEAVLARARAQCR